MPEKLKLKRTQAEREEREWRKAERAARKARKHGAGVFANYRDRSASPSSSSSLPLPDLAQYRAELEEAHFRAKMFDALDEDQRLDSVEASFNSFVPPRWSQDSYAPSSSAADARAEEEEYAEWVRREMWRRTHRNEVEQQERIERNKAERSEKERAARKVLEREEKEKEATRRARRAEREAKRKAEAWAAYRALWDSLNASLSTNASSSSSPTPHLSFTAMPWPMHPPPTHPDLLNKADISDFLLASHHSPEKSRKQRIREALLAYHPDRFVGRYLPLVLPAQRTLVEEGVGRVVRALNSLMEEDSSTA